MYTLYPDVVAELSKMPKDRKEIFEHHYKKKHRDKTVLQVLAVIFPIQLFLLKKFEMGFFFVLSFGGLGIWWIIEIFRTRKRVFDYNHKLALSIIDEIKGVHPKQTVSKGKIVISALCVIIVIIASVSYLLIALSESN